MSSSGEQITIDDADVVSRLLRAPFMLAPDQDALIWENVFSFSNSRPESLHLRKLISTQALHELGCEWQWHARQAKPKSTYRGALSTRVEIIRSFENVNGHGFDLKPEPSEGASHIHLLYRVAEGIGFTKSDKNELKLALQRIFRDREPHTCVDTKD